ncbi:MAG TPA: GNAT family N-acetyltransferase [Gemmataceae bacterium]
MTPIERIIGPYEDRQAVCQDYDRRAVEVAQRVAASIRSHLPGVNVEHIGSTSVPGCAGKGIVDLMLLYPDGQLAAARDVLNALGFQKQTTRDPFPEDRPMRTGSVVYDGTTFLLHVHVIAASSPEAKELCRFRDWLRADPDLVTSYVAAKKAILASGVTDSLDYCIHKGEFVQRALQRGGIVAADCLIRPETTADHEAIRHVNRLAFGQDDEAWLVDGLRDGGYVRVSLIAERADRVVGHILFSDLPILTEAGTVPALALAPMAVLPGFQQQGIGSALVRRGLEVCKEQGHRIVVVLGHPHFYPRFGFSSKLASPLASVFGGGDSWMALELVPGALDHVSGKVAYPPPFDGEPEIRPVRNGDQAEWLRMRALLWPDDTAGEHAEEVGAFFGTNAFRWSEPFLGLAVFVAVRPGGGLSGFLEASIRPFAEGCETQPVGYVEGWYVDADLRQQGIGKRLVRAAEQWATKLGCREMASDAHPENKVSLVAHQALGFEESSRAVHLRKRLPEALGTTAERSYPSRQLSLLLLDGTFAVCRLDSASSIPPWATADELFSITRTADELSILCRQDAVPEDILCERGWRCWRVAGTISFSVVGVLASLTAPLAEAGISVFAISTFDTDYLLVKAADLGRAVDALRRRGHTIQ